LTKQENKIVHYVVICVYYCRGRTFCFWRWI